MSRKSFNSRKSSAYQSLIDTTWPMSSSTPQGQRMTIIPYNTNRAIVRAPIARDNPLVNLIEAIEEAFHGISANSSSSNANTVMMSSAVANTITSNLISVHQYNTSALITDTIAMLTTNPSTQTLTLSRGQVRTLLNSLADVSQLQYTYQSIITYASITYLAYNTDGYRSVPTQAEIAEISSESEENQEILSTVLETDASLLGLGGAVTDQPILDSGVYTGQDSYPLSTDSGTGAQFDEAAVDLSKVLSVDTIAIPLEQNNQILDALLGSSVTQTTLSGNIEMVEEITTTVGGTEEEILTNVKTALIDHDWNAITRVLTVAMSKTLVDEDTSDLRRLVSVAGVIDEPKMISISGGYLQLVKQPNATIGDLKARTLKSIIRLSGVEEDDNEELYVYNFRLIVDVTDLESVKDDMRKLIGEDQVEGLEYIGITRGVKYTYTTARGLGSWLKSAWNKIKKITMRHPEITKGVIAAGANKINSLLENKYNVGASGVVDLVANGLGSILTSSLRNEKFQNRVMTKDDVSLLSELSTIQKGVAAALCLNAIPNLFKLECSRITSELVSGNTREVVLSKLKNETTAALKIARLVR